MPTFFAGQTDYIEKLNDVDAAAGAAQDDIDAHIADTTAAHAATAISNTPAGNIAATTVQAAINELDSEKLSASATALPSSFASASINSVTPTGGTLSISGAIQLPSLNTWALTSFGDGNFYISRPGVANYVVVSPTGLAVTGSISATGSIGVSNVGGTAEYPIDVIRADASAVSLRIRNDSASANAYSMVGVNASGNAWGMRMGSAAANSNALEWVLDAFSSPVVKMSLTTAGNLSVTGTFGLSGGSYVAPSNGQAYLYTSSELGLIFYGQGATADLTMLNGAGTEVMRVLTGTTNVLINQTTNPNSYKLAVTGNVGVIGSISATSYIEGAEQTAPAAPAANGYRIFAQDNGAGKTQLMVIFASGAAQQIAIEP